MPDGNTNTTTTTTSEDGGESKAMYRMLKELLNSGVPKPEAERVKSEFVSDNFRLREKLRQTRKELDDTRKKIPGEGTVVLTKDQVKLWEGFQKIGKSPEELTGMLSEAETTARATRAAEAATALQWNPDVLQDLVSSKGLVIEMRETKVGTETKRLPHVVIVKDGVTTATRLDEADSLKPYHAALSATTETQGDTSRPSTVRNPLTGGLSIVPSQRSQNGTQGKETSTASQAQAHLGRRYGGSKASGK